MKRASNAKHPTQNMTYRFGLFAILQIIHIFSFMPLEEWLVVQLNDFYLDKAGAVSLTFTSMVEYE